MSPSSGFIDYISTKYHNVQNFLSSISLGGQLGIHYAISSLGIVRLYTFFVAISEKRYFSDAAKVASDKERYFPWLQPYHFPTHKYSIIAYIMACLFTVSLFILLFIIISRIDKYKSYISKTLFPSIFIADTVFLFLLFLNHRNHRLSIFIMFLWIGLLVSPFSQYIFRKFSSTNIRLGKYIRYFASLMLLISSIEFVALIFPLAGGNIFLLNEYFEIPSQTYVQSEKEGPHKPVDNISYINRERLWGNQLIYDLRKDQGNDPPCLEGNYLDIGRTNISDHFYEISKNNFYFHFPNNKLCFLGVLTYDEYQYMRKMLPEKEIPLLDIAYIKNRRYLEQTKSRAPSNEQADFIAKNRFEWLQVAHDLEMTFHHHFQLLNPIKELSLGRPINEIVSLYGANFIVLKVILDKIYNGISYEAFLHLMFSTYLIYYACFIAIAYYVTRDIRYVAAFALISFASIMGLGFVTLFTGLSYAPVRHFADIFIFLLFYRYLQTDNTTWLFGAFTAAIANVFLDRVLGSFILIAFTGTLLVRLVFNHTRNRRVEAGILFASCATYSVMFVLLGKLTALSPYNQSFLDGVWGFSVSFTDISIILTCIICSYAVLAFGLYKYHWNEIYLVILVAFYCQIYFLYWFIVPNYGHLYVIVPHIAFGIICLIKKVGEPSLSDKKVLQLLVVILAVSTVTFSMSSKKIWRTLLNYQQVAKDHVVYKWNFPNMQVDSSMEPDYFARSANLIAKYAGDSKEVYILSKYDTLLLFLSRKYSKMPHFDLSFYINGPETSQNVLSTITHDKPVLLFVDTDIRRNQITAQFGVNRLPVLPHAYYNEKIRGKANRLSGISNVFAMIEHNYAKIEQTELLTVYSRK